MQPVLFSVKEARSGRPYWRRTGSDVCYFKNRFKGATAGPDDPNYMTASFTVNFPHAGDVCYLAYHYPYSYTKLMVRKHHLNTGLFSGIQETHEIVP